MQQYIAKSSASETSGTICLVLCLCLCLCWCSHIVFMLLHREFVRFLEWSQPADGWRGKRIWERTISWVSSCFSSTQDKRLRELGEQVGKGRFVVYFTFLHTQGCIQSAHFFPRAHLQLIKAEPVDILQGLPTWIYGLNSDEILIAALSCTGAQPSLIEWTPQACSVSLYWWHHNPCKITC